MERLWPIITVVGPILLGLVILWALIRNRATREQDAVADRGARELREREDKRSTD